jgi:hypothetical protein
MRLAACAVCVCSDYYRDYGYGGYDSRAGGYAGYGGYGGGYDSRGGYDRR